MKSMPMPRRARCSLSTPMISACVVTSRAVVGSSHTSRRGDVVSAPAIMTRCSMPPENSCGYCRRCSSGRGRRTAVSSSTARALAASADHPSASRSASVRWSPMVRIGLMPARGSWKIIAAPCRRSPRSVEAVAVSTPAPSSTTSPVVTARAGRSPSTVRAVSDLPEPDSPTSPTVSPAATESEMPWSSRVPSGRSRVRSRMPSRASPCAADPAGAPAGGGSTTESRAFMPGSPLRCGRRPLPR